MITTPIFKNNRVRLGLNVFLFLFLCLFLGTNITRASAKPLHVLIIHSYSQEYPWTIGQHQGFVEKLKEQSDFQVTVSTEYLETKLRHFDQSYGSSYRDFIEMKYANHQPDAVYVTDDNAYVFARDYLGNMFEDVPVFFSGVNDLNVLGELDRNRFSGVFEKKDVIANLDLISRLQTGNSKVIVVGDASETYQAIKASMMDEARYKQSKLKLEFVASEYIEDLVKTINVFSNSPVLLTTIGGIRNQQGQLLSIDSVIEEITSVAKTVVISMEDAYMNDRVHAGFVTSSFRQGETAANLLLQWHNGVPVIAIEPVTRSPNIYMFNESALSAIGFDIPRQLIAKSKIIYPIPGFLERHQSLFLSALVILSGFLLFSVFLLIINFGERYE